MNLFQKRQRYYLIGNNRVTLLMSAFLQHRFTFLSIFQTLLQLTTRSSTINAMQFTVLQSPTTEHSGFWKSVLIQ